MKSMDRRQFLALSTLGASAALGACSSVPAFTRKPGTKTVDSGLSASQWQALIQVQHHLLPSEADAPGAKEVNADQYLNFVLTDADFDANERRFIATGLDELQGVCQRQHQQPFEALSDDDKERCLRAFEGTSNGYAWLSTVLNYLLEALLTDPLYGGNPEGIGWQWLEHTPGFPRPTVRYQQLRDQQWIGRKR